ncbi:MAG: HlyD family efflux transporter periplasmic adaptor subunit [Lewinellaceae bacterium]|nr:HlyD family efflux transporter periplasmic adaptor subunit [Lewinellaceae bacterium]
MLNITDNVVHCKEDLQDLESPKRNKLAQWHTSARNLFLVLLAVFLVFLFLPWTQNIQAGGKVTTLRPEHRPQTIHATIAGRIESWYVVEGQQVRAGDTIVHISEVKSDYFDPDIVQRVGNQVQAKEGAISSYDSKVSALEDQIAAMERELISKTQQIGNKIRQAELKIESDQAGVEQARVDIQIARRQFDGTKNLYDKGLKSLTELEDKKGKLQESEAKMVGAENKLASSRNDLEIYKTELVLTRNEYANKIAKAQSDKYSTLSEKFDAQGSVNKLRIERENYSRRSSFYYIVAPQDGYVVQAITPGIGEIVKEGDPVVSILPADYQLAVEIYIRPMDLPLIRVGNQMRFLFDGWPAFFFSGWPGISLGTFAGRVVAIDRNIGANGKFRLLVAPDQAEQPWPDALRIGGGAKGIALLKNVPLWYEFWRILNGFPPDLYQDGGADDLKKDGGLMPKAPIKKAK